MAKVLIVDDDPDVVEAVELFLKSEGHEVVGAFDRDAGMAQVRSFCPDLIILDVMMEQPDDGITMAQDLRREGFKRPIVMLTSVSKAMGLPFGKDEELVPVECFIEKPVDPETLVAKVRDLLTGSEG